MPMPTLTDLQGMYGLGNPMAYSTARDNAGLERQYREAEYGRQQALAREAELKNMYSEQDQPLLLEQKRLTNQNLGYTGVGLDQANQTKGLQLERDKAMQKYNLDADQRKALLQVTDDELKQADQVIEQLRRSLNPEEQKRGQQLYEFTGAARALKQKQADEMAKEKFKEDEAMKRAKLQSDTSYGVARINQDGQTARKGMGGGSSTSAVSLLPKLSPDKRLGHVKAILDSNIDPDTKAELTPAARAYYESMYEQDVRTQDAKGTLAPQQPVYKPGTKQLEAPTPRPSVRDGATPSRESKGPVAPAVGEVRKGYKYLGGNPADPKSWSKI